MGSLVSCVVCPHVDEGTADKLDLSGVVCVGRIGVVCAHEDESGRTSWGGRLCPHVKLIGVVCPHVDEGGQTSGECLMSSTLMWMRS